MFEFNTAEINRRDSAGDRRQVVVSILLYSSTNLATTLASSFTTLIPILKISGGCLGFLAFSLLPFVFVTLRFFYVTFVLVVMTFATVTTGDGTPKMVPMGCCLSILGLLPSFHLQHTTTAENGGVLVSGLISFMARRLPLSLPPPWLALVGFLGAFPWPRSGVGVPPRPRCFLRDFSRWESIFLSRACSISRSTRSSYTWVRLFLSEVVRQSSHIRAGILLMSRRWGSVAPEVVSPGNQSPITTVALLADMTATSIHNSLHTGPRFSQG